MFINKPIIAMIFTMIQNLIIAEKALLPGWVMYVDDDDQLNGNGTLENVVSEIHKHDEDTLHAFRFTYPNGDVFDDAVL
jgi:hypothetical protein